jgi:hypothetical protein
LSIGLSSTLFVHSRLAGSTSQINRLKEALAQSPFTVDLADEETWNDTHALCGVLKTYIRGMKEPVLTNDLYQSFIDMIKDHPKDERPTLCRQLVHSLPPIHYDTLEYLITHLARVTARSAENKVRVSSSPSCLQFLCGLWSIVCLIVWNLWN